MHNLSKSNQINLKLHLVSCMAMRIILVGYNILNICVELWPLFSDGVHKVAANHLKNNERMRYLTKVKRAGFGLLNKN